MIELNLDAKILHGELLENRMLFLSIKGLLAADGSALDTEITALYTTQLSPWYSTVMRVRMFAGEFLTDVPDITVAQFIQYFSMESDLLNYRPEVAAEGDAEYRNSRARWVTLSIVVALLSGTSANSMMQKRLGDLSIRRDRAAEEILYEARRQLRGLSDILQDGGNIGRDMDFAVKGIDGPDQPAFGRQWADPTTYPTDGIPAANSRERFENPNGRGSERNYKRTYKRRKID